MDRNSADSPEPELTQRRSARVPKQVQRYALDTPSSAVAGKRKRRVDDDNDDDDDDELDSDAGADGTDEGDRDAGAELSEDEPFGSSDDNAAARRKSSSQKKKAKPPSLKRAKTSGASSKPPTVHAASLPTRPKKKAVRMHLDDIGEGLYADVFSSGDSALTVAEQWHQKWEENDSQATTDMVNFLLQCAGCDQRVTVDNINDVDNCAGRLTDIQLEYQEQSITEYPLVSKTKKSFHNQLVSFHHALVSSAHESERLYKYPEMLQNLLVWFETMSSSTLRPFRHTATTALLAIADAVVDVAVVLDKRVTRLEQQHHASVKGKNKAKATEMKQQLDQANGNRSTCGEFIEELFSTVFVNRYRDVDSRIRSECVEALGTWIRKLPLVFLDANHLRYLGWMLSDTVASTRLEVAKQLEHIFKRDSQQLGHFIDRFRPRIIEMACRDVDVLVRTHAIAVADVLRDKNLLEPTEVDSINKLIFDHEAKVRKAVAPFFDACVKDVIQAKMEELGGQEAVVEVFDATEVDDFDSPREEWVNIKCLGEMLAAADAQLDDDFANGVPRRLEIATDVIPSKYPDSRLSHAAHALYDLTRVMQKWETIAGYLLFDHTTSSRTNGKSISTDTKVKEALAPEPAEEAVLLEVLSTALKSRLQTEDDKNKKNRLRTAAAEAQEESAIELAATIPKLLNKFGADPETATTVLRMEHFLDLDVFQQLRQHSSKYEMLLDEVVTQFGRHNSHKVISEATLCLLHARQCEELEELTDSKLVGLWDNLVNSLYNFDKTCELSVRGSLAPALLAELSTILLKISRLASVANCVAALETQDPSDDSSKSAIDMLIDTVHRGKLTVGDAEIDDVEDEVAAFATKCCQFYFMWKIRSIQATGSRASATRDDVSRLSTLRSLFSRNLIESISSRRNHDELRLFSAGSFCDLYLIFVHLRSPAGASKSAGSGELSALVQEIDSAMVPELASILDAAERNLAKKAKKQLNGPDDDEEPEDDEDDDEDDAVDMSLGERQVAELKAEKALCDLAGKYVLAILAKVLDQSSHPPSRLRKRMMRNHNKLGANLKEIVSYLDEKKHGPLAESKKAKAHPPKRGGFQPKAGAKSAELVISDDESELSAPEPVGEDEREEDRHRNELVNDPIEDGESDDDANRVSQAADD